MKKHEPKSFSQWFENVFMPYYAGWTVFFTCVVVLLGFVVYYAAFDTKPDLHYGVFTGYDVSAGGLEPMTEKIGEVAGDINNDGKSLANPTISFTAAQGQDEYAQMQFAVVQAALLDNDLNLLFLDKPTLNYFLEKDYLETFSNLSPDLPDVKYIRFDNMPLYGKFEFDANDGVYIALKFYKPELEKNNYQEKYKGAVRVALEFTNTPGGEGFLHD